VPDPGSRPPALQSAPRKLWARLHWAGFLILTAVSLGGDTAWFQIARSIHSGRGQLFDLWYSSKTLFFGAVFASTAAACGLVALGLWARPGALVVRRASLASGVLAFLPILALSGITLVTHMGIQPFILAAAGAWGSVFVVSGQNYVRGGEINGFVLMAVGGMLLSTPVAAAVVTGAAAIA
jgi:hypothetical protein